MIRALAACALVFIVSSAPAQSVVTPKSSAAAPQPTIALPVSADVSACGEESCPESAHVAGSEQPPSKQALLRQKLAELNCLQSEIDELRRETGTPQQILVKVQVLDVSRTRMRAAGLDVSTILGQGRARPNGAVHEYSPTAKPGSAPGVCIFANGNDYENFINTLQRNNLGRILAEPSIVTMSGRPASFNVGGELPLPAPRGSNQAIEFRRFGQQVDVLANAIGENRVRLELRVSVSEPDESRSIEIDGTRVPSIIVRQCDSAMELEFGQTGVLTGLVQRKQEVLKSDTGNVVQEQEVELLFIVTPEAVSTVAAKAQDATT
ncbi:MAG: hypothetical protein L0228_19285, partial [Planctomycetes bacterium]|nr:hypothetical protein [Planctomycetota bacterium]